MHYARGTTGTQQGLTETAGFVLMETVLAPSIQVPMHTHENATIVLIVSGDYRESFRGSAIVHAPMTVIAKPAGERHANDIGARGARCLVVELTDAKRRALAAAARPCEAPHVSRGGAASRTALQILRELRARTL
jgi:quercetin dioxygenase-like cupin family protein